MAGGIHSWWQYAQDATKRATIRQTQKMPSHKARPIKKNNHRSRRDRLIPLHNFQIIHFVCLVRQKPFTMYRPAVVVALELLHKNHFSGIICIEQQLAVQRKPALYLVEFITEEKLQSQNWSFAKSSDDVAKMKRIYNCKCILSSAFCRPGHSTCIALEIDQMQWFTWNLAASFSMTTSLNDKFPILFHSKRKTVVKGVKVSLISMDFPSRKCSLCIQMIYFTFIDSVKEIEFR